MPDSPFEMALDLRVAEVLERCTSCGACVEVCPMPAAAGIDANDPLAIAGGVLSILRGTDYPADAARWATVCSGSGHCIPACQHGVNPRFMLAMARLALQRRSDAGVRRRDAFARFGAMTKGVRVLSRMQMPPELLSRFRADDADDEAQPDVASLRDFLQSRGVAIFKAPEQVAIWEALPRNDAGKVLKHQIQAALTATDG